MDNGGLCQNFSREGGASRRLRAGEIHRSTDMSEKANPAGGHVSTTERNGLMAMMLRLDAAEFEARRLDSLRRAIAARRGGCMRYDKIGITIFDGTRLSLLSYDAVFDNAYFDMKFLMRAPTIPSSMR
jgi:hypothetical protein